MLAEKFVSNPGCEYETVYTSKVHEDGTIELVASDKKNIQSEIQSHAGACDIRNIMNRYMMGDTAALSKAQGFYTDLTNVPNTHAEWLQRNIDAKNIFDGLPADIKSKFRNDFDVFASTAGSEEWLTNLGFVSAPNDTKSTGIDLSGTKQPVTE